jgi:hypothetical protein
MAMQYEHAGPGAAWPLIETALVAPDEEHWLDAPPEPLVRYAGGEARIAEHFESVLLDTGMAEAGTALAAQEAFGVAIEHARHLTLHDLAAMMAMQYEHAGLGSAWPVLETALMAPSEECWLDAAPEPLLRFAQGEARIALFDDESWLSAGFAPDRTRDEARLQRDFDRFQIRQRQLAALFEAHGIPVLFEHCPAGADPREVLRG